MIKQKTYKFGNLTITQTIINDKSGITKHNDVTRNNGKYDELLNHNDPDYSKACILIHNEKMGYNEY